MVIANNCGQENSCMIGRLVDAGSDPCDRGGTSLVCQQNEDFMEKKKMT
jgi:hypothetical protein